MLQSTISPSPEFIAPPDLTSRRAVTSSNSIARKPAHFGPVLVPSIAKTAGLGRFVYLVGRSKNRYVFSGIAKGQISLYNDAVFAVAESNNDDNLWVGTFSALMQLLNNRPVHGNNRIFVHLLAEGNEAKSDVIADLARTDNDWHCPGSNMKPAIFMS